MSQRILVLGASGYIGQHLVKRLSEQGFTVLAAARQIDRLKKQQLPGVECYSLDLNQPDALPALLAQADTVCAMACSAPSLCVRGESSSRTVLPPSFSSIRRSSG